MSEIMGDNPGIDQHKQKINGNQINIVGELNIHPTASHPAPHQIPPPPPDFTGRADEINEILSSFDRGATIVGLRGMGGMGKTALALVLADHLKDRFLDGQIFVDMRGTGDNPLTPAMAMAQVVRAYNPDAHLPEDLNEMRGLYLSVLSDKKALLLLDNAKDERQVSPLTPPKTWGLIVTSRQTFKLPKMEILDLGRLKVNEAKDLLLAICPRIGGMAKEIAETCGYLPLALRATASLLENTRNLDPIWYVGELKDERTRLEKIGEDGVDMSVEASFNLSYVRLSDETAEVFRMVSVFPADFDAEAEEEVCHDKGHGNLNSLLKLNLVEYIKPSMPNEDGRYRLHDLVRMFAAVCLKREDTEKALFDAKLRHAEHYKNVLSAADDLYMKGEENILAGLKLFDLEWSNIQSGQSWAEHVAFSADQSVTSKTSVDKELLLRLCSSYTDAGDHVLRLRLHPREMIHWQETALAAARQLKNRCGEGNALGSLGIAYRRLGEYSMAIEFYRQYLTISREIGDRWGEGNALGGLGNVYDSLGVYRKAIKFHEQRLTISREIKDRRGEGKALDGLGRAYQGLEEYRKAIEFHKQALAIAEEIKNPRGEENALNLMGIAYKRLGEYREAIESQERNLAIASKIRDEEREADALWSMSLAFNEIGNMAQAIDYGKLALKIYERLESPYAESVRLTLAGWRE